MSSPRHRLSGGPTPRLVILALLFSGGFVPSTAPASGPAGEEIVGWVQDLDSDRFLRREVATEQLIQAGREAIEAVVQALDTNNLEVTTRGVYVLQELALRPEEATADAARAALERVAQPRVTSAARRASEALARLDRIRHERAMTELQRLGATLGSQASVWGMQVVERLSIEIGESWRGEAADLARLRDLKNVDEVILNHTDVDDEVLRFVGQMGGLTVIRLRYARISDAGLEAIQSLEGLRRLSILYAPISDAAVPQLVALQNLNHLQLYGTELSESGGEQLAQGLPGAELDIRPGGGFLGIGTDPTRPGCVIYTVRSNTAAEKAGLRVNDVILKYDGTQVEDFTHLTSLIAENKPGDTVPIEIARGEQRLTKDVRLGDWERVD